MVSPGDTEKYRCNARIEHMMGIEVIYNGPSITVNTNGEFMLYYYSCSVTLLSVFLFPAFHHTNTRHIILTVLSTLTNDNIINNTIVNIGDTATFSCSFLRRDTDFNIIWKIREFEYPCDSLQKDSGVQCYIAGNASVLHIVNTTVLGTGTREVECILQPNIHQNYTNDVSFQSEFNENTTRAVTLEVIGITSTMSEFHCVPFSTFVSLTPFLPNVISCSLVL